MLAEPHAFDPRHPDHDRMVLATGDKNYDAVPMRRDVFQRLPADVQPLYQHFVTEE